ncbi:hypothetical protein [Cesiribacter sp. SM1]|uniref:hypothetical protein n=1 Tax=Cesiribacter sp. SM1 TaxID=2861196 RepID=UPI001CD6B0CD|nr:hypothetical protein [Cesiribacter sp. SM1]
MKPLAINIVIWISTLTAFGVTAQEGGVAGRIVNDEFEYVYRAKVTNKTTREITHSDTEGHYQIGASVGDTLTFEIIGYTPELRIIDKNPDVVNIILMDKSVNDLGTPWTERQYRRAHRRIEKIYCRLYKEADNKNIWNNK